MSELAEDLEGDLKWREGEIASLKIFFATTSRGSVAEQAGLRALCAMLYAHYEGYSIYCWNRVLDEIANIGITRGEVSLPLLVTSLEGDLRRLLGGGTGLDLVTYFRSSFQARLTERVEFADKIRSDANIWSKVFIDCCAKVGIACQEIDRRKNEIRSLVARRNEIAHGKKMTIKNLDEYQIYENAALMVMCDLAVVCLDFVESKRYLGVQ